MGTLALTLPSVGQPNSTEDPKVRQALVDIQTLVNGNLDGSNLATVPVAKIATLPYCRLLCPNPSPIADATWTSLQFGPGSETYDTDGMHDTLAFSGTRIVAATAGLYSFSACVQWAQNGTGARAARFLFNGGTVIAAAEQSVNSASDATQLSLVTPYKLIVGQYVELQVFQNSGGTLTVNNVAEQSPVFSAVYQSV